MLILETSEAESVLSLDLSQIDPVNGIEIHNSELRPTSVIHLQLSDVTASKKPVNWLRAYLSGSQAELIIHSNKVPLVITRSNFLNFKSIKLDDAESERRPTCSVPANEEVFDVAKILEIRDFLRPYVQNPNAKLPNLIVLENFLLIPDLYAFSIMTLQHAVKNHGAVPTDKMVKCMAEYLIDNPDTKESLVTSCLLSLLKIDHDHLKHLSLAKLAKVMDETQNTSTSTYIGRLINNILNKVSKPEPELRVILQQIVERDEDATKTKNCKFFLSKLHPDEESLQDLKLDINKKEDAHDPRFNAEDLKGKGNPPIFNQLHK